MKRAMLLMTLAAANLLAETQTRELGGGGKSTDRRFSITMKGPTGGCTYVAPLGTNTPLMGTWIISVTGKNAKSLVIGLEEREKPDSGKEPGFVYMALTLCGNGSGSYQVTGKSE